MMKIVLKNYLSKIGVMPILDILRHLLKIISWTANGCKGIAPPPVKRMVLSAYLKQFGINVFVESGTHVGDTLAFIAHDKAIKCVSLELSPKYHELAQFRFSTYSNVTLFLGDSANLLPEIVSNLREPALFWLDGHYSGSDTAKGKLHTPISKEMQAIFDSPIKNHVILIDDARCFDGSNTYPNLNELLDIVRRNSTYKVEISADIIRLTPPLKE